METLKIKFKLHALEYEVEGQQEIAREEFRHFNENILTHLLSKVNIVHPSQTISYPNSNGNPKELPDAIVVNEAISPNQFPILKDVKLRDLPGNETEWLIIYAFYASNFGTREFTRDRILELYKETDRRTDNRIKSLSQFFKNLLRATYIKSTNDTNYIILQKGKSKAIEILEGKSTTKTSTAKKSSYNINEDEKTVDNNKKSKTISQPIKFVDLKFEINEMKSFTDYFKSKSPKTQNDEVAIAIQWFEDNKDSTGATIECRLPQK